MRCIHCHSPFLPLQSQLKHKHQLKAAKPFWLSSNGLTSHLQTQNSRSLSVAAEANVVTTSLVLGVSPPATSGDLTVLIQTSAVLIFIYWIANFVVPEIISKNNGPFKETSEGQKLNDKNPLEEEEKASMRRSALSSQKKRGFDSTKPR